MLKMNKKLKIIQKNSSWDTNRSLTKRFLSITLSAVMMFVMVGVMPKVKVNAQSQADALVSVALAEEGYTEGANNYNKYGIWYNYNNAPWCAMFISWCANQAGIPESIIKKNASADNMYSSKKTGNFGGTYYPKNSISPQKGDIVYYDWNRNGCSDHVEIVISINESSKTFTSIGGNTTGDNGSTEGVRRHSNYSFTSSYIVGFERPNYNGSIPPQPDTELGINYPRPSGSPYLQSGATGSGVSWLQTALNKANNAGLAVDGQFGSGTKQAVINFQKANGLTADGIAGPSTINKLVEVIKGQSNMSLAIARWISNDKMGSAISTFETYKPYYLCYRIFDENSQKPINAVTSKYYDYKVHEVVYKPDGSLQFEYTYNNSDENWIKFYPEISGTYKYVIKVEGKLSGTYEKTFTVSEHSHSYGSWTTTKSATCTSDGSKKRTCSICGASETQTISKTGHSFGSWSTVKSATCTSDGSKKRTCSICGASETQTISKTGHKYTEKNIAPTSTQKGYTLHTCSMCGSSYKDNYTELILSSKTINLDLNGTNSATVSITVNGYLASKYYLDWNIDMSALSKTSSGASAGLLETSSSIGISGLKTGTYTIKVLLKDADTDQSVYIDTITVNIKCSHKYTTKVVAPTYTEKGYTLHTCSLCGDEYKDNYTDIKFTNLVKPTINIDKNNYVVDDTVNISWQASPSDSNLSHYWLGVKNPDGTKLISETMGKNTSYSFDVNMGGEYTITTYATPLGSKEGEGSLIDTKIISVHPKGDINSDDKCSIADAVTLQKYLVKYQSLTKEQFAIADINNDGKINVFDLILLKRMIINNK